MALQTKMVPQKVVNSASGHGASPKVSDVELLVTPLNPASRGGGTIDQNQCINLKRNVEVRE